MTLTEPLIGAVRRDTGPLARLTHRGAARWYAGSSIGLIYQVFEVVAVWTGTSAATGEKVVATIALLVFYGLILVVPPLVWPEREAVRVAATLGLLLLATLLVVPVGETAMWTWMLVLVVAAFTWSSQIAGMAFVVGVSGLTAGIDAVQGWPGEIAAVPYVTASVGVMMVAFGHQVRQTIRLRAANHEIARLAVDEERARFARDLHDSLGHSLTVVAVKSELAGKLVERDAVSARAEIADVERLAREALADLRSSVAGVRAVTLEGELVAARAALAAGGVVLDVRAPATVVRPELRPLFAWAVREGVTNVLRHAAATSCTISLSRSDLRVRDDGAGAVGTDPGSGLRGLAERAAALGAHLEAGPVPGGGYELRVHR